MGEHAAESRTLDGDVGHRRRSPGQRLNAENDQIRRTGISDGRERAGRGNEKRRKTKRGSDNVNERAAADAHDRYEAGGTALLNAACDDVQDRWAGREKQSDRGTDAHSDVRNVWHTDSIVRARPFRSIGVRGT